MRPHYHFRFMVVFILLLIVPAGLSAQDTEQVTYTIQRGDTMYRIALRYGVGIDELAEVNNIGDVTRIKAGQVLIIPGLAQPTTSVDVVNPLVAASPVIHTIARGESLAIIARQYGITVDEILIANNIVNPDRIYAGQELQIWTAELSADPASSLAETAPAEPEVVITEPEVVITEPEAALPVLPTPVPVTTTHIVLEGEYLSGIARRYGLNWTLIAEANGITDPNTIYAGMELRIPDATALVYGEIAASVAVVPAPAVGVGREIVVDLSSQMTYAFEDGGLQYSALSSTGLPATPTVQGDYKIYIKYDAQRMTGPGYDLPGVQWVMYFYQGYALHGAYWHNNFGNPMSHGCVNLRNEDALWFYNFASIGTPVHVQW